MFIYQQKKVLLSEIYKNLFSRPTANKIASTYGV